MHLHQPPHHVEPHAGAVGLPGRRSVPLGERFEELADGRRIEVRPRVADPQDHLVADPARDEPHRRARPGVHQRVVHQVRHDLVQGLAGHPDRELGRQVDRHAAAGVVQARDHLTHDLGQVGGGGVVGAGGRGGRQHVLQQSGQAIRVGDGRVEHVVELGVGEAVPTAPDREQGAPDARQRRPELVRDRGDEVAADAVGLLQPGHEALLALVELLAVVLHPPPGLLVVVPEDHLRAGQREDEARVEPRQQQGVVHPRGGLVGDDVADREAGEEDEGDGQQVDGPVLVERDERDHHEEVEVHRGQAVGEVHEDDRAAQQAEARGQRAHPPHAGGQRGREQQRRRARRQHPVREAVVAPQRVPDDGRQVQGQNPAHQRVAGGPVLGRQAATAGEPRDGTAQRGVGGHRGQAGIRRG